MEAHGRTHLNGMALNEAGGGETADWLPGKKQNVQKNDLFNFFIQTLVM